MGVEGDPDPVKTAAGGLLQGEAERGDPGCPASQDEGDRRGEMLLEEAWPRALRAVTGEGEVGRRCVEGRGDGRQHVGGMRGLSRGSEGRGSGGCAGGGEGKLPRGWLRQSSLHRSGPALGPCKQ